MAELDNWWRGSLCAEIGPDLFFMEAGENGLVPKKICRRCDVRLQCLADSLRFDEVDGVFGGFGVHARRRMRMRVASGENRHTVAFKAIAHDTPRRKAS